MLRPQHLAILCLLFAFGCGGDSTETATPTTGSAVGSSTDGSETPSDVTLVNFNVPGMT